MFRIGEAVIDDEISEASFCCDLDRCKGACCCIEGGRGAPLEDDEVLEIEKAYPVVKHYLSEKSREAIGAAGLFEGTPGNYATTCVEGRECVFAYFQNGVARCSFERAYEEGLLDWRKPISCHLFPIRIRTFGKDFVRYDMIDECQPGREFGKTREILLSDFLQAPLVRRFGEDWYKKLKAHCDTKTALK
jgi:hypothetical protein